MSSPHWKSRCTSEDTPLSGKVNSGKLRKLKKLGKLGKLNSYATAQYQKHSKNRLVVTSVFQFSTFPDSALAQLPEAVGQPPRLRGTASPSGKFSGRLAVGQPPRLRGTASMLLGRRYNRAKKAHGGDRKSEESRDQCEPLKTAEKLAAEHGVSPATVKRAINQRRRRPAH